MKYCDIYWKDLECVSKFIPNLNQLYNKTIFISGVTGMIGSAVADLFLYINKERKAKVHLLFAGRNKEKIAERFNIFKESKDYDFIYFDATINEELPICADYWIHAASNADPKHISLQPIETMMANIMGLNSVLSAATEQKDSRILYISSSEVYGIKGNQLPYIEDEYGYINILNPRASYPCSKRAGETLCAAYGKEKNVDTVIVRPGHIYGPTMTPNDSRASSQFPRDVLAGKPIVMKSKGEQLRSYCYVLDCASAILTVLLNGEKGNAYNISNKDSIVTIREMAEAFAKAGNQQIIFDLPSEEEKKSYNLMNNSSLNAEKLEQLGWKACFNMQEGAEHTLIINKKSISNK